MHFLNNKTIELPLLIFIVLYPWYYVISGIDMTDTGYWLTYYKNFFDDPSSATRGFPVWLSLVIGATTNTIFGGMGLMGFKIMNVFTIYLLLFLTYRILILYTNRTTMLFTLSIAVVFVNIDLGSIVGYGGLTALFYLLAAYFIYFGLVERSRNYLVIAGIVLGLNIFIRFPNLLGIGLIVVIFYYDFISGNTIKNSFKKVSYVFFGYIFSIIVILILMKLVGHLGLYFEGMSALMNVSKDPSASHGASSLLKNFINDQVFAFVYGFILTIGIFLLSWLSKYWNSSKVISWCMVLILSFLTALFVMKISNILSFPNYYFLHRGIIGVFYLLLIFIILKNFRVNPKFSTIALIALLIIELLPLGSDTHLRKYSHGMYLGLPIILIYLYSLSSVKLGVFVLDSRQMSFLKNYITITLILFSMIVSTLYFATYGDNGMKFKMTSTVNFPLLRYNLTTKHRVKTLTEVLENLQKYELNYEYMFIYGKIPLIQYLSNAKPYIDNPSPLFESSTIIKQKLKQASNEKSLPIVVRAITAAADKEWPFSALKMSTNTQYVEMGLVVQDFLNNNNYKTVWQNNDFEILIPSKKAEMND